MRYSSIFVLCVMLSAVSAAMSVSAQYEESGRAAQPSFAELRGIVQHVDPVRRELKIGGHYFRAPAGVKIVMSLSDDSLLLNSLEAGMHVEYDAQLSEVPGGLGEIRFVRILPQ